MTKKANSFTDAIFLQYSAKHLLVSSLYFTLVLLPDSASSTIYNGQIALWAIEPRTPFHNPFSIPVILIPCHSPPRPSSPAFLVAFCYFPTPISPFYQWAKCAKTQSELCTWCRIASTDADTQGERGNIRDHVIKCLISSEDSQKPQAFLTFMLDLVIITLQSQIYLSLLYYSNFCYWNTREAHEGTGYCYCKNFSQKSSTLPQSIWFADYSKILRQIYTFIFSPTKRALKNYLIRFHQCIPNMQHG